MLVDAGISCRETERRMRHLNLSLDKVRAIFISHEHIDHIRGVYVLSAKYNLTVYITPGTFGLGRVQIKEELKRQFVADAEVCIGSLSVIPFSKYHDAADPHSFTVSHAGITVGVFTDLGIVCDNLRQHFGNCHAAFLEANYDNDMLDNGRYPYHLKQRIRGGKGHLSNHQALELFVESRPQHMTHLLLAHLSAENNSPGLVHELFNTHSAGVHVEVAPRTGPLGVFHITGQTSARHTGQLYTQATLF